MRLLAPTALLERADQQRPQQLGGAFFVEPLFNGSTLVVSIGIAGFAQRRRGTARQIVPIPTQGPEVRASQETNSTS